MGVVAPKFCLVANTILNEIKLERKEYEPVPIHIWRTFHQCLLLEGPKWQSRLPETTVVPWTMVFVCLRTTFLGWIVPTLASGVTPHLCIPQPFIRAVWAGSGNTPVCAVTHFCLYTQRFVESKNNSHSYFAYPRVGGLFSEARSHLKLGIKLALSVS